MHLAMLKKCLWSVEEGFWGIEENGVGIFLVVFLGGSGKKLVSLF